MGKKKTAGIGIFMGRCGGSAVCRKERKKKQKFLGIWISSPTDALSSSCGIPSLPLWLTLNDVVVMLLVPRRCRLKLDLDIQYEFCLTVDWLGLSYGPLFLYTWCFLNGLILIFESKFCESMDFVSTQLRYCLEDIT